MNLRIQAFIFLLLLVHQSFEINAQALLLFDGDIYGIQNPSGAFLDPLDLPLPWIFFEQSDFLASLEPKALVKNRNLFEQFPKYLYPQFPENAPNFFSGVAGLVGEALIKLATGYVAENVLRRGTTFLSTQNAAWATAWTNSADKIRQCIEKINQGQGAPLEQEIQNISTDLANAIKSSQLTEEENLIIFHLWHSTILEPFKDAAWQNKSTIEMFANMSAQINAVPNSIEYQNMLFAQFEARDPASAKGFASQMFSQVNKYQKELGYKQAYNFYTYLSKKSQLNEEDEAVFSYTVSQEDDSLFQISTFNISNLDKSQWNDLVNQLNLTIISYLTTQNIPFLSFPPFIYTYLESDQEIELIPESLESENVDRFFRIKLTNFTEDARNELLAQVNQTITNTFSLSVQPDIAQLLSSVSSTLLSSQVTDGIQASFKIVQTEQSFYQVSFDASSTYNLWADSLVCSWDFGDGTDILRGVNLFNVAHAYNQAGNYTVTLKVRDFYGHSIIAKGLSPVIILFNQPSIPLTSLNTYYIAGKSQGWMFLDGNSYYPIPFVNGSSQATLFVLNRITTGVNETWTINARGVNGEIINNYLGAWGLPADNNATLQASFLPQANFFPPHTSWKITPLVDDPGYFTIQNTSSFYLTITGEFQKDYEPYLCGFTFTSGAQKTQAQLVAKLREAGSQTLPNLEFINQLNTTTKKQVKITPSTGVSLLNFFPYNNTGYYSIAHYQQAQNLLTSNGKPLSISFVNSTTPEDDQLWSVRTISDTYVALTSKEDSQNCLNYNLQGNAINMADCPAQNLNSCYDRVGRFISKLDCGIRKDQYCCDNSLLSSPSTSRKLYYDSCQTCSSGRHYCPSVANQENVFVETPSFENEKCEPERTFNTSFNWYFNRIDPATAVNTWMTQVSSYLFSLRNVKLYNVGYRQFLCQKKGNYPSLCDEGTSWNLYTYSENAEYDQTGVKNIGVMIEGTGTNNGYWLSGTYVEDNNRVYSIPKEQTKGHFWKIQRRGYNSFMMKYGWNAGGDKCLTPYPDDGRADGAYEGKILFTFVACDPLRKDQYWYYGY